MNISNLPSKPQPDLLPEPLVAPPPSLWLYVAILSAATGLVFAAATIKDVDWPGLFVNLATELFGAIVILILVDRRLRASEVRAIQRLPMRAAIVVSMLLSPTRRNSYRYASGFLLALSPLVTDKVTRPTLFFLEEKLNKGFLLLADPGFGKTTWLQIVMARMTRTYLEKPSKSPLPILFPLRLWLPDRTLEEAIHEYVNSFTSFSRGTFRSVLRKGNIVIALDGYDELFMRNLPFLSQFDELRKMYPLVAWTVSSRPDVPSPSISLEVVNMTPPTAEEIAEIRRRFNI